jgi:hypothetical protein
MMAMTTSSSMRVKPTRSGKEGALNERGQAGSPVLERAGNRKSVVAGMEKPSGRAEVIYEAVQGKSTKKFRATH